MPIRPFLALACAVALAFGAPLPAQALALRPPDVKLNDRVEDIARLGSRAYLTGRFTNPNRYAMAVDAGSGAVLSGFQPPVGSPVHAVAATTAAVYLGLQGQVLAVDPNSGKPKWSTPVNGAVWALEVADGKLFVGAAGSVAGGGNLVALNPATGSRISSWNAPAIKGTVRALAVQSGWVYVSGHNGRNSKNNPVLALSTSTGSRKSGFSFSVDVPVFDIDADSSGVYIAAGGGGGRCIGLSTGGARKWEARTNGDVQAVAVLNGEVYCGGHYGPGSGGKDAFAGAMRYKLAAVQASTGRLLPFSPKLNSNLGVWALDGDGPLLVGGDFTTVDGANRPHYAVFG